MPDKHIILKGKDAKRFLRKMKEAESHVPSEEEIKETKELKEKFLEFLKENPDLR
jgi:hypothetical protein